MDWITFIKWNGIVYASYYGANLLVDFLRIKGELSNNSNTIQYNLKDLGVEQPKVVRPSDFQTNGERPVTRKADTTNTKGEDRQKQISFGAPIERQAIPLNEYIKIAAKSGNQIFQPTI